MTMEKRAHDEGMDQGTPVEGVHYGKKTESTGSMKAKGPRLTEEHERVLWAKLP